MLNGESEGLFQWFHDNGQLQRRGKHKQGKLIDQWEYFDIDGQLIETKVFKNGMEISTRK
jgi:antitoxin component YwqK of YwqJK toxin-antitoxin module